MTLELSAVLEARSRVQDKVNLTPVMSSRTLDTAVGGKLFFKCEHLQKIGAFKARGATNAVFMLGEADARRGVVTHSSGNHAAALARAAALRQIPAYIVMPDNAPKAKQASVRRYGGEIIFCAPTLQAREETARSVAQDKGATFIHPSNDLGVMAGQGTAALELLEQVPDLDLLLAPVGGGGLLSGLAVATKGVSPRTRVIGVEPSGADDAQRSFRSGVLTLPVAPKSIADGLLTALGDNTFAAIRAHVDDIVTVEEASIVQAMRTIWEVLKQVVEPSGAVAYSALVQGRVDVAGKRVGVVLSGGNLDLDRLPWQMSHSS